MLVDIIQPQPRGGRAGARPCIGIQCLRRAVQSTLYASLFSALLVAAALMPPAMVVTSPSNPRRDLLQLYSQLARQTCVAQTVPVVTLYSPHHGAINFSQWIPRTIYDYL